MRVLHILNDVTDRGNGIVNAAVDLAIEQARQGDMVAVVSAGGGYQPLLESAGVLHLTLDQSRRPMQILRSARLFHRQLLDFRPDVVHAHMRTGLLLAWFWRHFEPFALVGHVHNVHDRESVMMGLADRVIAVSHSVAATMAGYGIPARKLRVVLNRTLNSPRQPRLDEIQPAALCRPSIVTVCGMTRRKGLEELIDAFEDVARRLPQAHLYLVGDGPERDQFERKAQRSIYNARIHFEGFKTAPQAYMLSADVFVLAARRESFGLVLTEARQAGCAIVATDADGIPEALEGGQAGMLVQPRNATALADALYRMLSSDQERARWQKRAQEGIEKFRLDRMAREISDVYGELVGERKKRRPISGAVEPGQGMSRLGPRRSDAICEEDRYI
jgi:glycosyltransferase involved in cell wall biosynthesis